jgi:hypothetical protein
MAETITRYTDFWPFYLREHAKPATRYWHFLGTALAIGLVVAALASQIWWLLIGAPVAGYAFAWISHMTIEHNRPATFTYPTWSLVSDFRMFFLWVGGRLGPHLARAGVSPYNP